MEDLLATKCRNCNSQYGHRGSDIRRVPFVLSCGCTLCMGCISKLVRGDHVKCIQCGKKSSVCAGVKEQLQPNYYLLGRLVAREMNLPRFPSTFSFKSLLAVAAPPALDSEAAGTSPSPSPLDIRCEECLSLASLSCPQCDGHYCLKCFETVHMSSNSMRRHKPLPLSQLSKGGGPAYCSTHLTNLVDYYCKEDARSCCSECCITGGHKGHQVVPLCEAAESQRHKLIPLVSKAKNSIHTMMATSAGIDDHVRTCCKEVKGELGRLERLFGRTYSLLQLHQLAVTERLLSTAFSSIAPVRKTQVELLDRVQEMRSKVKLGEAALKDDHLLVSQGPSLVEAFTSIAQLPLFIEENDLCSPKVNFDLIGYNDYLGKHVGTITSNGVPVKSGLIDIKDINGVTSPSRLEATPSSTRPSSTLSDYHPSSSLYASVYSSQGSGRSSQGSGRSSQASSYQSLSPVPLKRNGRLRREDMIEVTVSHIVSIDEFYVQSLGQQKQLDELTELLMSHSSRLEQLGDDAVKAGLRCVARVNDQFYRAHISSVQTSPPSASIKLIDYSRMEELPVSCLYALAPPLSHTPALCVQCHLHAIKPPRCRNQHLATPTLWSSNATHIFHHLVGDRIFGMKVYRQTSSTVLSVDLVSLSDLPGEGGGRGLNEDEYQYSSIIDQLIERDVAVLDNRKWAEPLTLSINLGAGDCLDVTVPTAENPWDFYVQLVSRERDLQRVSEVLSHHVGRLQRLSLEPFKGMLCVCQFSEDGSWYRAQVKELRGERVLVNYVDYGNSETVGRAELCLIPNQLLKIPFQAVHCRLQVQPPAPQTRWSEDFSDLFNEMVGEPSYSMIVKELGEPLSVKLIDKATNKSLSDTLVEMNMAEYVSKSAAPDSRPLTSIPPPNMPSVGDTLSAKVVHIESLGRFFLQCHAPGLLSQLSRIQSIRSSPLKVNPGSSYLASFHGDGEYHRVSAVSVSKDEVKVYYVDYGNLLDLPLDQIFPIPSELVDVPALAFPCSLVGGASETADSASLLQQFSSLVADKVLSVTVKGRGPHALLVSLLNEQGVDIEKKLFDDQPSLESGENGGMTVSREEEEGGEGRSEIEVEGGVKTVSGETDSASYVSESGSQDSRELAVCVTFVSSEGIVFGHDVSPGSPVADNLRLIDTALDLKCHASSEQPAPCQLVVGQRVCAKSLEDGLWYRATVSEIMGDSVTVYYGDYGNKEQVTKDDIIPEPVLPDLRPQAIGLQLSGFSPTQKGVELLSNRLIDQEVNVKVIATTNDLFIVELID